MLFHLRRERKSFEQQPCECGKEGVKVSSQGENVIPQRENGAQKLWSRNRGGPSREVEIAFVKKDNNSGQQMRAKKRGEGKRTPPIDCHPDGSDEHTSGQRVRDGYTFLRSKCNRSTAMAAIDGIETKLNQGGGMNRPLVRHDAK